MHNAEIDQLGTLVPTTILAALKYRLANDPDSRYIDFDGDSWSVRRFDDASRRVGAELSVLGVQRGDRVAALMLNSPELVVLFFATLRIGAVSVPINTAYKGEFLRHQLRDSGANIVVVQPELRARIDEICDDESHDGELHNIVVV